MLQLDFFFANNVKIAEREAASTFARQAVTPHNLERPVQNLRLLLFRSSFQASTK